MSGINDHLYAKNYFNRAQAIDKIEAKGERADLRLNTRVNALSPQAKQLPAWVKPAGYAALAMSAIAATAFISSQTAPQTSTPNPNPYPGPNPTPAPVDPTTRRIAVDPKSTPDLNPPKLDILINLGGDIQTLDEIPAEDDRICWVTSKSHTPKRHTPSWTVVETMSESDVSRKSIKELIEDEKQHSSECEDIIEVAINCDSEFVKSKQERSQQFWESRGFDRVLSASET